MINNLAAFRRKANLTQKEFADKLGIGTVTLSKWENPDFDLKELKLVTLGCICEIFHINISQLVDLEEK